jgi:hypothetical protein
LITARNRKGLLQTGLSKIAKLSSTRAVRKGFEENPLHPGGQSLLASESPIGVGVSGPTRPDFPEYGYRFFQTHTFNTDTAGVSPQHLLIPHAKAKVKQNTNKSSRSIQRFNPCHIMVFG